MLEVLILTDALILVIGHHKSAFSLLYLYFMIQEKHTSGNATMRSGSFTAVGSWILWSYTIMLELDQHTCMSPNGVDASLGHLVSLLLTAKLEVGHHIKPAGCTTQLYTMI